MTGRLSGFRLALAACIAGTLSAGAGAQDLVADFASGPPSGRYAYASSTPKTLAELLQGTASDPVNVVGHLYLPAGNDKVPAVVMVPGSGGIYEAMLDFWPKRFNATGIAVLSIDVFGPRGVKNTADDQSQVPFTADVADAFAALRMLATHPRIDAQRIAVMGFSRGGIASMRAGAERVIASQKLPGGLRFAAHVQTYTGGCTGLFRLVVKPGTFTRSPMLFVHGDADDYTPIAPCQDYADRIGKAGTPVEFVVLPGANHKFDADDLRRIYLRGAQRSKAECVLETDIDTLTVHDRTTGQRLQGAAFTEASKACGAVGANIEGNRAARDQAADVTVAFLKKALAR
ncbi:MAG: prolyl oligopeptidase family serine peptidase [Betaproteobacteria bacterium]